MLATVAGAVAGVAGIGEWLSATAVGTIALFGALATGLLTAFDPDAMRRADWQREAEWEIFGEHCCNSLALGELTPQRFEELRGEREQLLRQV